MTPLEINNKIAEIKGYNARYFDGDQEFVLIDLIPKVEIKYNTHTNSIRIGHSFNWAKNISDAWELFEEMPRPQLTKGGMSAPYYFCLSEFVEQSYSPELEAPTAALAICKAWLKWKGK